jgi:hypothetical protein
MMDTPNELELSIHVPYEEPLPPKTSLNFES